MYSQFKRARNNSNDTAKEIIAGVDYEAFFAKRSSWYTRIELEYDKIERLDLRTTVSLGYGYYFIQKKNQSLRGRIGLQYRNEAYSNGTVESLPGLELALKHSKKFKSLELKNELIFTPAFEDVNNYRLIHESSLTMPLKASNWSIQMGIKNEYNSMTIDDVKELDTNYFARLLYTW